MKKFLIILLALIVVLGGGLIGWYILMTDQETPLSEVVTDLLPFGSGENIDIPSESSNEISGENKANQESFDSLSSTSNNLFRIVNAPVAGATVFKKGSQVVVRYAERATGHIYDIYLPTTASSTIFETVRVTNNTLPKIYEAHFRPDGSAVIFRSLKDDSDTIENISLTLTAPAVKATSSLYSVSSTPIRG